MIHPSNVLFLDIETIPDEIKFKTDPKFKQLFVDRFKNDIDLFRDNISLIDHEHIQAAGETEEQYSIDTIFREKAGFIAEFNHIVCVCVGVIVETTATNQRGRLYIKSINGTELEILTELARVINKIDPSYFCGHNGIAFDFPILQRKFWMHKLAVPKKLNNMGKKPWETNLLDTMTMWGLGEYRAKITLDRLAYALGLPSPKAEFSGADVLKLFLEGRIKDVAKYCQGDVKTLVNCFLRLTESELAIYEDTDLILK